MATKLAVSRVNVDQENMECGPPPAKRNRTTSNLPTQGAYCLRPLENRASRLRKKTVAAVGKLTNAASGKQTSKCNALQGKGKLQVNRTSNVTPVLGSIADCPDTLDENSSRIPEHSEPITDIDLEDCEDPLKFSCYISDVYSYLFYMEKQIPISPNFLAKTSVTNKARKVLVDWLVSVNLKFSHRAETLFLNVEIIDRFLNASKLPMKMDKLQLLGSAALLLAAKIEQIYPPAPHKLVDLSDHAFNETQLLDMEIRILRALNFEFSRPSSVQFLKRFLKATKADGVSERLSMYLLELSLTESSFVHILPSELAASCVYIAVQATNSNSSFTNHWDATARYYSRQSEMELQSTVGKIVALLASNPENSPQNAVYMKYSSTKLNQVALLPGLKSIVSQRCNKRSTALF